MEKILKMIRQGNIGYKKVYSRKNVLIKSKTKKSKKAGDWNRGNTRTVR